MLYKFIYKFIDLLLIYKLDDDQNNIFYSLNYKIHPYELKNMTPPTEEFFTYIEYINEYLDILFNRENIYIYNNVDEKIFNEEEIVKHTELKSLEIKPDKPKNIVIEVGSRVKWTRNRIEETGEIIKIGPKTYLICCKPGKSKDDVKGALYMVPKNLVSLE